MPTKILFKRGNFANLPVLSSGEPTFLIDAKSLIIGNGSGGYITIGGYGLGTIKTTYNTPSLGAGNVLARYTLSGHEPSGPTTGNPDQVALDFRIKATSSSEPLGDGAVLFGSFSTAHGDECLTYGNSNTANGASCFAGGASVAIDYTSTCSIGLGQTLNITNSPNTFACGLSHNISNSFGSFACGVGSTVTADRCTAHNNNTSAGSYAMNAFGQFNTQPPGSLAFSSSNSAIVVGNGTSSSTKSNCFRVRYDGNVYGLAAFNASGADYSEFFEWRDGNPSDEDRVGFFVVLSSSSDKIERASASTKIEDVLGVISHTGSIRGNAHSENWQGMYVSDDFGRIIYDETTAPNGDKVKTPRINPLYDSSKPYIPREDRKEWDSVGLVGRVLVRDDGSCTVGGFCRPSSGGVGTRHKDIGYRVLNRINARVVEILIK